MNSNGLNTGLFNASGCVASESLLAYRDNKLTAEDLQAVELHLAGCLMCSEALEGFQFAGAAQDVEVKLEAMRLRFNEKLSSKKQATPVFLHPSSNTGKILIGSIAATFALLLAFFFVLLKQEDALSQAFADGSTLVMEDVIPAVPPVAPFESLREEDVSLTIADSRVNLDDKTEEQHENEVKHMELADSDVIFQGASGNFLTSPSYTNNAASAPQNTSFFVPDSNLMVFEYSQREEELATDEDISKELNEKKDESAELDVVEITAKGKSTDKVASQSVSMNEVVVTAEIQRNSSASRKALPGDDIYTVAEKMPSFPGGNDSLQKYIQQNLDYQDTSLSSGAVVYISYIVNERGKIKDPQIVRGYNEKLNEAVLKLVKNMPDWIPGEQNGKKVKVRYTLPVNVSF